MITESIIIWLAIGTILAGVFSGVSVAEGESIDRSDALWTVAIAYSWPVWGFLAVAIVVVYMPFRGLGEIVRALLFD